ncbi:sperm acrosome-associated protein 5-like [Spea bombifrons]|uniref:sperm acrosome-associated protein 5-like n=1 Tax=Spea bombifrons TaxID=233779 RepID=UPI00234A2E5B|nr:sperm acrosome-associated protein 5-like [Spea bombifrons]
MIVRLMLVLLTLAIQTWSMDRCALVNKLREANLTVKGYTVEDYTCMAYYMSRYDTSLHVSRSEYGVFQINSYWWCYDGETPGRKNLCGLDCTKLLDADIEDDIKCLERIVSDPNGLSAWSDWGKNCEGKDLSNFTAGC